MLILDRFEGKYAIIEEGDIIFSVLRSRLPVEVRVGDVLIANGDSFTVDNVATDDRRNKVKKFDIWKD